MDLEILRILIKTNMKNLGIYKYYERDYKNITN